MYRHGTPVRIGIFAGSVLAPLGQPAWAQSANGAAASQADLLPSVPAPSDTVLPRTGIDPAASDLREHLLDAYGDPQPARGAGGPALQFTGQFGASEEYTDNVGLSGGGPGRGSGGDFITALQPGITVVDTSQRLRVNLTYAPIGQIYAENSGYSQLEQIGSGGILVTALPGWLYVDVRGSINQQAVFGGLGSAGSVTLAPDNRETVSSLSISPYVSRTLGTAGTIEFGAGAIYSATDAPSVSGGPGSVSPFLAGAYGSSYLMTKRVFANYTTGENYGRLRNNVGTDDNFYDGSGALAGGKRLLVTDDVSYAATRLITVLGELGYEDLAYPRSAFFATGPVGAGGLKLTPRRGSSLTLEYRYIDGFGSVFAQGSMQVSPRIRIFGGYSAGISTLDQDQQTTLLDGAGAETGAAAAALQAAPLLGGQNDFTSGQTLQRLHRLDVSATFLAPRDTLTASVQRETTDPVGRQIGGIAPIGTSGIFASLTGQHELTPTTSLNAFVQYGSNRTGLNGNGLNGGGLNGGANRGASNDSGETISVSAGVDHSFTDTLIAYARVGGIYVVGGSAFAAAGYQGLGGSQTTVTVGALKRF